MNQKTRIKSKKDQLDGIQERIELKEKDIEIDSILGSVVISEAEPKPIKRPSINIFAAKERTPGSKRESVAS